MPKCLNCTATASCSCSFTNGLCSSCYKKYQLTLPKETPVPKIRCSYTISQLQEILQGLLSKEIISKEDKYYIDTLRDQIKIIDKRPCKYEKIINTLI